MHALQRVGIAEHALKRGSELSGGQQQRAAIARTLVEGSDILIADEPIASLDPKSARRVMDILADLNLKDGITVLVSLHQVEYALSYCPRTIALRDGRVVYDGPSENLKPAFLAELYGAESEELFVPGLHGDRAKTPDAKPAEPAYYPEHKDSAVQTVDDVLKCDKSMDFGIGDPNSTSGFLVPTTFIFSAKNIDPRNCFKTVRSANHEANALAVANKLVGAATNNNENLRRLEKTAPEKAKEIKVVWTSPLIPSGPLVWRKDLDETTKKKLTDFIFSYGTKDEREKKILAELNWAPFRKSDNTQLLPIRQMEVNKTLMKLKGEDAASDPKKQAEMAELQKEFDDLGRQIAQMKK
jgi:ABC-type multidrug transport system ATPase subunit